MQLTATQLLAVEESDRLSVYFIVVLRATIIEDAYCSPDKNDQLFKVSPWAKNSANDLGSHFHAEIQCKNQPSNYKSYKVSSRYFALMFTASSK